MIESLSATFAQEGFTGEVTANEGDYLVTINADGSLQVERDNWGFSVATPDGTFILTVDGTDEGTWSADDASISRDHEHLERRLTDSGGGRRTTRHDAAITGGRPRRDRRVEHLHVQR